jgi:hypothetical protein
MNCKQLEGLLIAYTNGELRGTLKQFIEEHLTDCAECQTALAGIRKTREKLLSLRNAPAMPEIKEEIMATIKNSPTGLRRMVRPIAIVVPALFIAATILTLQLTGVFFNDSGIIAKAYAASSELKSFRFYNDQFSQYERDSEPVLVYRNEGEFTHPDSFHIFSETFDTGSIMKAGRQEIIRIGNTIYTDQFVTYPFDDTYFEARVPSEEKTIGLLNLLGETTTLDDETIDGTDCYHYLGEVDTGKFIKYMRADYEKMYYRMDSRLPNGMSEDLETWLDKATDNYLTQEVTYEFWIGKDDYILRQTDIRYRTRDGETPPWNTYGTISILKYYDVNEEIAVDAPLTKDGDLLPGWYSYEIDSTAPDETLKEKPAPGEPRLSTGIDGLPSFIDPDSVPKAVCTSYRSSGETREYVEGTFTTSVTTLLEYGGSDQLHSRMEYITGSPLAGKPLEIIVSGNQAYTNMGTPILTTNEFDETLTAEDTIRKIDQLYSIVILPEEIIDGTACYHLRGILDTEDFLTWFYTEWEKSFASMNEMSDGVLDFDEGWETIQTIYRSQENVYEYWFGKEDYLIRKQVRLERDLTTDLPPVDDITGESTRQITHEYYDFNEDITVDVPLDESGNLLDGWMVSTLE